MPKGKREPKVVEPKTWEEFLVREWEQWRVHHSEDHPPSVNYNYKVGQQVIYGRMPDCRVEEIHRDGQLIVISFHDRGENYGKPYDNNRRLPRICWWSDIDPIEPVEETKFSRPRIQTQYTQTSLDSLMHTAYRRGFIDSPDYQRGYVWTLEDKQRLIKSIFDRMDIGKFVTLEYPYPENRLEIVDGKQRLRAIMDFYEGRFAYEGKTWFQLSWMDKQSFTDIMVQVAQLDASMVKKSDILWLFLAINKGGVPQTEEHVSHARALYEKALQNEKQ